MIISTYAGKFQIITTRYYASKLYNSANNSGDVLPTPDDRIVQDDGFDLLQDNGSVILYTE
jgi:hypothetical protein